MNYIVIDQDYLKTVEERFANPKEAEKALRLAPPGTYSILRIVAEDAVVEAPLPIEAQVNRVVVGKRSFARGPRKPKSNGTTTASLESSNPLND